MKYKIAVVPIAGVDHYQVYSLIDPEGPDEEGNRDKVGGCYAKRWCAEQLASVLNKED